MITNSILFIVNRSLFPIACILLLTSFTSIGCKSDSGYPYLRAKDSSYAVSPNDQYIAYTTFGDKMHSIYLVDISSKTIRKIFTTQLTIFDLSFAEGNSIILFSAGKSSKDPNHIYKYDINKSQLSQLTYGNGSDLLPSYSKFNNRVLFIRSHTLQSDSFGGSFWTDFSLYSIGLNGGNEVKMVSTRFTGLYRPYYFPHSHNILLCPSMQHTSIEELTQNKLLKPLLSTGGPFSPVPSSDGKTIYFISDKDHPFDYEIWSMNKDGSKLKQLTHLNSFLQDLTIDKTGLYLYFRSDPGRVLQFDLDKLDIRTGNVEKLFNSSIFSEKSYILKR